VHRSARSAGEKGGRQQANWCQEPFARGPYFGMNGRKRKETRVVRLGEKGGGGNFAIRVWIRWRPCEEEGGRVGLRKKRRKKKKSEWELVEVLFNSRQKRCQGTVVRRGAKKRGTKGV